ncbi:MAG: (2Fe-2S)-binding protein [Pirellulales bacterium]|nr:(2Fe-2S)-binding protein [Pirellulales bacterium]
MDPNQELCLCFHVTRRKVENFIRIEKPRRVGQLAECYGAGTGCGWCRPFLKRLFEAAQRHEQADLPSAVDYARGRTDYVREGHGTPPPGATPVGQ